MDGLRIIENLDSLWLFSNVFSSRTQSSVIGSDDDKSVIDQNQSKDTPKSETSESMTPIIQRRQTQVPSSAIVVQRCPECGHLAVEQAGEERRKRSKRRFENGTLGARRKNVREFGLGFDVNNIGRYDRFKRSDRQQHHIQMPSLRDGLAMKEHLKSWARAVACTVR